MLDPEANVIGLPANRDDVAVGFSICVFHETTWQVRLARQVEDRFVAQEWRRCGGARRLLESIRIMAAEREWSLLDWDARTQNPARVLYDNFGQGAEFVRCVSEL